MDVLKQKDPSILEGSLSYWIAIVIMAHRHACSARYNLIFIPPLITKPSTGA
jgi:hypothetical protein